MHEQSRYDPVQEMIQGLPDRSFFWPVDVARVLGVSRSTVYRWIEEGKLIAIKIGGKYKVPRRSLIEFLES